VTTGNILNTAAIKTRRAYERATRRNLAAKQTSCLRQRANATREVIQIRLEIRTWGNGDAHNTRYANDPHPSVRSLARSLARQFASFPSLPLVKWARVQAGRSREVSRARAKGDERTYSPPLTGVKPKVRYTARGRRRAELRRVAPRSLSSDWPARNPRQRTETSWARDSELDGCTYQRSAVNSYHGSSVRGARWIPLSVYLSDRDRATKWRGGDWLPFPLPSSSLRSVGFCSDCRNCRRIRALGGKSDIAGSIGE